MPFSIWLVIIFEPSTRERLSAVTESIRRYFDKISMNEMDEELAQQASVTLARASWPSQRAFACGTSSRLVVQTNPTRTHPANSCAAPIWHNKLNRANSKWSRNSGQAVRFDLSYNHTQAILEHTINSINCLHCSQWFAARRSIVAARLSWIACTQIALSAHCAHTNWAASPHPIPSIVSATIQLNDKNVRHCRPIDSIDNQLPIVIENGLANIKELALLCSVIENNARTQF